MIVFVYRILLSTIPIVLSQLIPSCRIGPSAKCLGDTTKSIGYPTYKSKWLYSNISSNANDCFNNCSENENCFMATFHRETGNCSFYENISFTLNEYSKFSVFLWECCNTTQGFPVSGRCPGFWKSRPHYSSDNKMRKEDPLAQFPSRTAYKCQMECLVNGICGAINLINIYDTFKPAECQLIINFPMESIEMNYNYTSSTYQWQCSDAYELPKPDKKCKIRKGHHPGYWLIQENEKKMSVKMRILLRFYTYDYNSCLENCMMYTHCSQAWYSTKGFVCLLKSDKMEICSRSSEYVDYNFTTYVWKECREEFHDPLLSDGKVNNCGKISSNDDIWIYPEPCGNLPIKINRIYKCVQYPYKRNRDCEVNRSLTTSFYESVSDAKLLINMQNELDFNNSFQCQNYQSFRVIRSTIPKSEAYGIFSNLKWLFVSTGYESFWLVNITETNFVKSRDCAIYDADFARSNPNELTIISRNGWYSPKPAGDQLKYPKSAVPYVIITNTVTPLCNCFTIEACSDVMREINRQLVAKTFLSIPYNYVVTGDGIAYEARGWDYQNQASTAKYNAFSFSIAFCGNFISEPKLETLRAVKQLINLAVMKGKVSKDYILLLHYDVSVLGFPCPGLARVLQLWPHFRNHERESCSTIKMHVFILNFIAFFILSCVIIAVVHWFFHRIRHDDLCNVVRGFCLDEVFGNSASMSRDLWPRIKFNELQHLLQTEICVSPFTANIFLIEDKRTFLLDDKLKVCQCKSSIFSILNVRAFQFKLVSLSNLATLEKTECHKMYFLLERPSMQENERLMILHFKHEASLYQLLERLYRHDCVCDCFTVTKFQYNSKYFVLKPISKSKVEGTVSVASDRPSFENDYCRAGDEWWVS